MSFVDSQFGFRLTRRWPISIGWAVHKFRYKWNHDKFGVATKNYKHLSKSKVLDKRRINKQRGDKNQKEKNNEKNPKSMNLKIGTKHCYLLDNVHLP